MSSGCGGHPGVTNPSTDSGLGSQNPLSPPDFHGFLVVRPEEVIGAVMLHGLAAILPNVEN